MAVFISRKTEGLSSIERRILETAVARQQDDDSKELVFQHGLLCQVGLPRSRQFERSFERSFKNASILVQAGKLWNGSKWEEQPLPFGAKPRVALLYINSEAVKKRTPIIDIGGSYKEFCRRLGLSTEGKTFYDLKKQMKALAAANLTFGFVNGNIASTEHFQPIQRFDAWMIPDGNEISLWPAELKLSTDYYESLVQHAVPLPLGAIAALTHSALALDILAFLVKRLFTLEKPLRIPFVSFKEQFGQEYKDFRNFKKEFMQALRQVMIVYPEAKIEKVVGGLVLKPSRGIAPKAKINGVDLPQNLPPEMKKDDKLTEHTIEKFRSLYHGHDVYNCKADFDAWREKKAIESPKNYQAAFLGFAKKWVAAKNACV